MNALANTLATVVGAGFLICALVLLVALTISIVRDLFR